MRQPWWQCPERPTSLTVTPSWGGGLRLLAYGPPDEAAKGCNRDPVMLRAGHVWGRGVGQGWSLGTTGAGDGGTGAEGCPRVCVRVFPPRSQNTCA